MSVHDAEPLDIYVDEIGQLWRCIGYCIEPTFYFEAVEGNLHTVDGETRIVRERKSGGRSGLMWNGWKRIFRTPTTQGAS